MKIHLISPLVALLVTPAFAAVYSSGHGDIGIAYEEEQGQPPEFYLHYHLGSTAVVDGMQVGGVDGDEFDADDITTEVAMSTMTSAPNNTAFNTGTGVAPGGNIWILPQAEMSGVPFLGLAAEELDSSFSNVNFTLGGVISPSGAGNFSLWQSSALGGLDFAWSTNDPNAGNNSLEIPVGSHSHYNWGFSEPGVWTVPITVSASRDAGGNITEFLSTTENFTFNVIPEPSSALLLGVASLVILRRRRA